MAQHPRHASLEHSVFSAAQGGACGALGWQHSPDGWLGVGAGAGHEARAALSSSRAGCSAAGRYCSS